MPKKLRQAQHRPGREGVIKNREFARVKREVQKLARQNARLRKEVARTVASEEAFQGAVLTKELIEEAAAATQKNLGAPQVKMVSPDTCPECLDATMRLVDLGARQYHVCPLCKHRERVAI